MVYILQPLHDIVYLYNHPFWWRGWYGSVHKPHGLAFLCELQSPVHSAVFDKISSIERLEPGMMRQCAVDNTSGSKVNIVLHKVQCTI